MRNFAKAMQRRGAAGLIVVLICLHCTTPASAEAGASNGSDAAVNENPVAAIVDGIEITTAEVKRRIKATFGDNPVTENNETIRAATLRSIIQERMVDGLYSAKDITPSIQQEIDVARRRILLNRFLEKNTARALRAPTEQEVEKFIAENPGYFDRRKTYHYTELIIKAGSPTIERAINDRLQQLITLKEPTPKDLQLLRDWLRQNNVVFGDSSVWQSTEQIPIDTLKAIDLLDQTKEHLSIAHANLSFRILSLFGAFPDPLAPELSKFDAYQRLLNAATVKARAEVLDKALLNADVQIPDKKLAKLILPASGGAAQPKSGHTRKMLSLDSNILLLTWSFFALIIGPFSLYQFYIQPQGKADTHPSRLLDLTYLKSVRMAGVTIGALALLIPAALIIGDHIHDPDLALMRSAFLGIAAAAGAAVLFRKSAFLRTRLASRGASFLALFLFQMLLIIALDPFSKS